MSDSQAPFPVEALPGPVATFVSDVARCTRTDPSWAATVALASMAGAVGNRAMALLKRGHAEATVLWGVLVGRSSTCKSPVLRLVTKPFASMLAANAKAYEEALEAYETAMLDFDAKCAEWKAAARKGHAGDMPVRPEKPTEHTVLIDDATTEAIIAILSVNPGGLLCVKDELSGLIANFDRYSSGKGGGDRAAWLSFYSGGVAKCNRKTSGSVVVPRACVSVCGSTQPGTLVRVFGEAEKEAGLLGRFLLAWPEEIPPFWSDDELADDVADGWHNVIAGLLAVPMAVDEHGAPRPACLPVNDEAKRVYVEWHNDLVKTLVATSDEDIRAAFGKLRGVCARIALVLAMADAVIEGRAIKCIGADVMRRACRISTWYMAETVKVYRRLGSARRDRDDAKLIGWIKDHGGRTTARDLARALRQFGGSAESAQHALDALVEKGLGEWRHPAPGPDGGRPMAVFVMRADETPAGAIETPCYVGSVESENPKPGADGMYEVVL